MTKKSFEQIRQSVGEVREEIEKACLRAGRKTEEVTLVGVTKTQSPEDVRAVIEAGVTHIGENRVQEWLDKEPHLQGLSYECDLIGSLQRNKAKFLPGHFSMVQSVNSPRLAEALEKVYAAQNQVLDILIEINIGGEASKSGLDAGALFDLAFQVDACPHLHLRGLMAIPPNEEADSVRPYFRQMHNLFVDMQGKKMDNSTVNILSMGMSSDFPVAIEEGSTMVRVGTRLFGAREKLL